MTAEHRAGRRWLAPAELALVLPLLAAGVVAQGSPSPQGNTAPQAAPAAQTPAEGVEGVRTTLEKWVQTKQLVSREKSDWITGREVMTARIAVVERESETLRQRIADADKTLAENEKVEGELAARKQELESASTAMRDNLVELERRTLALVTRLPEPLRDRVRPFSQRIPTEPKETKASLGERFASLVMVLNEVNKANREVTVASEVRALPDGTTAEVKTIYLGIGQGYYVTGKGDAAGVGTATEQGWVWTPANEHAAVIAKAIAIHQGEQTAAFVPLPIQIR